jgi:hypothetical protein
VATVTNLASTFVGIPIACLVLGEMRPSDERKAVLGANAAWRRFLALMRGSPWHDGEARWLSRIDERLVLAAEGAACFILLGAFFVASWVTEFFVGLYLFGVSSRPLWEVVFLANSVSYGVLAVLMAGLFSASYLAAASQQVPSQAFEGMEIAISEVGEGKGESAFKRPSWRLANERAERGIAKLKTAEAHIARANLVLIERQARQDGSTQSRDGHQAMTGVADTAPARRAATGG